MRADRLLTILLSLQVHQRVTARELADRLEVSERTIYRDMDALSIAGIPVVAERGTNGGWALMEEYRTRLNGLNEPEIQALFTTMPAKVLNDLGIREAYERALIKLMAALPSAGQHDAEFTRQRLHIDGAGWFQQNEDVSALPTLQEALWAERKLHLHYCRSDGTPAERLVAPLGLVAKGSIWYLIAGVEDSIRTYRVSRVQSARVMPETSIRPPDFDLAAYWEQSKKDLKANLPRYLVTLKALPAVIDDLPYARYAKLQHRDPPDAKGWIREIGRAHV